MTKRGRFARFGVIALAAATIECGARVSAVAPMRLLAVGDAQSCVVDDRDQVFCWGFVGGFATIAVAPTLMGALPGVEQLLPRSASVCARLRDGTVRCAGANDGMQLGAPGPDRREFAPVDGLRDVVELVGGGGRTCAWSRGPSLQCWGSYAERTDDGGWIPRLAPVTPIALPSGARRFDGRHFCVELERGAVMCESNRGFGSLVGPWLPAVGPDGRPPTFDRAMSCASDAMAGVVRCAPIVPDAPPGFSPVFYGIDRSPCGTIGERIYCRVGVDDPRVIGTRPSSFAGWSVLDLPPITAVGASGTHACALDANRLPFCWGSDSYGELGLGRPRVDPRPVDVELGPSPARSVLPLDALVRFDNALVRFDPATILVEDEPIAAPRAPFASDSMRATTVLATDEPITQSLHVDDTFCVLAGRTRCQLPDRTQLEPFGDDAGRTRSLWLDRTSLARVRDDGAVEEVAYPLIAGDVPRALPFTDAVALLSDNSDSRCALDVRGELRCIGAMFSGTIGIDGSPPTAPPERVASDVRSLHGTLYVPCYIDRAGAAFCWGQQSSWVVGVEGVRPVPLPRRVAFDRPVVDIEAAFGVVLVVDEGGSVYCRGDNYAGQCGGPPARTVGDWRRIESIDDAVSVHALPGQSCAIRRSGALACWGLSTGELWRFGPRYRSSGAVYIPIPAGP